MNILCTICARKGSKGLRNKNIKKLFGKPLIIHTIDQAKKSKIFSKIVVSSDSKKILKLVKKKVDLTIQRPKKLSKDNSAKVPVVRHALKEAEKFYNTLFHTVIDLDVTSPLRTKQDIINAKRIFKKDKNSNLISVTKSKKNPYFNMIEIIKNRPQIVKKFEKKILARQQAPKVFELNASIYIWKRNYLLSTNNLFNKKTGVYFMPENKSVDVDNKLDFQIVEFLMKKKV